MSVWWIYPIVLYQKSDLLVGAVLVSKASLYHQMYICVNSRYQYIYAEFLSFFAIAPNEGFNLVDRICPIFVQS